MVAITCFGIAVHPSVPAQDLKELIDAAGQGDRRQARLSPCGVLK